MKKIILAAAICLMAALGAQAKSSNLAFGIGFNYGTKFDQAGIGAKLQAGITRNFRIEPEFIYFFKNKGVETFDINCNFHYVVRLAPKVDFYPLAGLSYSNWSDDFDHSENRFGVNLGAGLEVRLASNVGFFLEERGQLVSDFSQSVTSLGLKFRF